MGWQVSSIDKSRTRRIVRPMGREVRDLANVRAALYECASEGNTPCLIQSINSANFLPPPFTAASCHQGPARPAQLAGCLPAMCTWAWTCISLTPSRYALEGNQLLNISVGACTPTTNSFNFLRLHCLFGNVC